MFSEFKQKIVKDYTRLTGILLLSVSLVIYIAGSYMSYKEQMQQIQMLAVEESEELYYKLVDTDISDVSIDENFTDMAPDYFSRIFIYGYDINHTPFLQHNNLSWSQPYIDDIISSGKMNYHQVYFHFKLVDNRHPKAFITMRYPLFKGAQSVGEVYVGMEVTHWLREQVRILFALLFTVLFSMIFVYFIAHKMAEKAMVPVVKSFEQQKQFIANASHELRTPLSIIMSGMTVLKSYDDNKLSNFSQDIVNDISDESVKMKKLIDNLLLSTRSDNNTLKVNPVKFALKDIIIKSYNKFTLLAAEKNISISLQNLPEISQLTLFADVNQIEQILAILIDNAIKYTDENGSITISVETVHRRIFISVTDTGKGISAEDLPHIFERFYRAEKSRTHYGNGLGLSIAKMLAQKNHGDITVVSQENKGSCFSLVLNR